MEKSLTQSGRSGDGSRMAVEIGVFDCLSDCEHVRPWWKRARPWCSHDIPRRMPHPSTSHPLSSSAFAPIEGCQLTPQTPKTSFSLPPLPLLASPSNLLTLLTNSPTEIGPAIVHNTIAHVTTKNISDDGSEPKMPFDEAIALTRKPISPRAVMAEPRIREGYSDSGLLAPAGGDPWGVLSALSIGVSAVCVVV